MRFHIIVNLPNGESDSFYTGCKDFNAAYELAIEENPNAISVTIIHVIGESN